MGGEFFDGKRRTGGSWESEEACVRAVGFVVGERDTESEGKIEER